MAKVISQETFDDVVRENVVEFEMDIQEAKEETIKQFEAQGINLANIIKDLNINEETGKPVLNETIDQLKTIVAGGDVSASELPKLLETLSNECESSVPHRVVYKDIHRMRQLTISLKIHHTFRWQLICELMKQLVTLSSKHWKNWKLSTLW